MLADALRDKGWTVLTQKGPFVKGDWKVDYDTSHWMIVSSKTNPRVFDIPEPIESEAAWTANLIEHLCQMEDERVRLRMALETIRLIPGAGDGCCPWRRRHSSDVITAGS